MKKKILWLCNCIFTEQKIKTTASWLQPLAELLQKSKEVQIYNITLGNVKTVERRDYNEIPQWIIPRNYAGKYHQKSTSKICSIISSIEKEIIPDLVHIWGTESVWASIYANGAIVSPAFIDIQGVLSSYYYYYYGGLNTKDILKCISLKEIILPYRTLFHKKTIFKKRGLIETKNLRFFKYISYQSEWVKEQISYNAPNAKYLPTNILLRSSFYTAEAWKYKEISESPIIFTSASSAIPYKGLHILFKSLQLLKTYYPKIQLRIAGQMQIGNYLKDGYSIYLKYLIKKYNIAENIVFLGPINEYQIIQELQECNVCVVPSFIETYCLAFAESMIIGVPTVVSFTGAMPELAEHKKEALFYNPIDHIMAASYIKELIKNRQLSEYISSNARERRLKENCPSMVLKNQLNIYKYILK